MCRRHFFIAVCAVLFGYGSAAQSTDGADKPAFLKNKSANEIAEYYRTYHARKPNAEQMEKLINSIPAEAVKQQKSQKSLEMPEKFWFPGEFEEVQAILISWSYIHVDNSGEYYANPINKDTAFWYDKNNNLRVGRYISYLDTYDDQSRMPIIFAQLADAIQQGGAQVWINIVKAADSTTIKNYMRNKGMPLKNYRFFISPNNSIWYRDCAPVAFYYGDQDSIAFLDFEYYTGRPADDKVPINLGKALNIPVYTSTVKYEGGNIILDGLGSLFTSDEIYSGNATTSGQVYLDKGVLKTTTRKSLSKQQVNDSLTHLLGLDRLKALPRLQYDGGTGHIDLYAAMWDENNFVFTKYPPQLSKLTDYAISSKNIDTILSMPSFFDKEYRGRDIPLPRKDNGTWYTSNSDFNRYTRTYSNSTFVNNVIIQPIFSDEKWGAKGWDLDAIEQMKKAFPGYKIIPIDIRGYEGQSLYTGFDGTGGAIHCITKQIPAENPIRILHGAIQDFADDAIYNGEFPIEAIITNKSGIDSAVCFWRVKGDTDWQLLPLEEGEENLFSAVLSRPTDIENDTIEYYLSATSNNGKTITKPMTAPDGFYSFYHGTEAEKEIIESIYNDIAVTALVSPKAKTLDHPDSTINLEVTIENNSLNKTFEQIVVNAVISDGTNDVELSDTLTDMAPGKKNYKFISNYIVPAVADYTVKIFVDNVDIFPSNDTLTVARGTILREDVVVVAFVRPTASSTDKIGTDINLEVSLENQCYTKVYNNIVINALITAAGNPNVLLSETITNFAPGTKTYRFDSAYVVPNVAEYAVKVFISKVDNYQYNDTIARTRKTNLGIKEGVTEGFSLSQNIPNPARDNTSVEYSIPSDGRVVFTVYSINGQVLYSERKDSYSGENTIEFSTANLSSGLYFYSIEYKGERLVKKMVVGR